ncbi:hypothetical protein [Oceanobacillus chungangensis]|uniref:Uncharacterized protein n=1 Tax=Oceanobacillus chungangensis TaxID=1229152 RepID=A0A3D8PMV7_9BACI|nr:hypothetical protein [Oceanobacillus chungangensis]RDW17436.1 hypothetical protein CWR45_12005 [Oceanobacillus chungangensis]
MTQKLSKLKLWIPLLLLLINIILFSFTVEELIDASEPNYGGGFKLLTPVFGLISFFYIRKYLADTNRVLIWVLQGLNWFFIILPVAVIIIFMLAFI